MNSSGTSGHAPDSENPPVIYLEPTALAPYGEEGRLWCQDDVWATTDPDEQMQGVPYLRADLVGEAGDAAPDVVEALELVRSALYDQHDRAITKEQAGVQAMALLLRVKRAWASGP